MGHARRHDGQPGACEIIDFDEAMLNACPPDVQADLMMEARLLAGAFAPGCGAAGLVRIATQLSSGERDSEMDRAQARRIAAALKRLARENN